ncbi:MAG TPA: hypothetical protein VKA19_13850 [Alphaproteobacteria bacterium]|nr:hypothetical protein [Alphaproteobacteria bacterium]
MNRLFAELRRRNVFRVGGFYAVIGWLLIQVIVAIKGPLHLPGWTDTFFVVLVLAGFPLALLLAWAFELTPEGVKLTKDVAEGESITTKTGRKLDYAILAGLALVVVIVVADRFLPSLETHSSGAPRDEGAAAPSDASIAVLPFEDLSPEGDQGYFADGMAEEILNVLANVPGISVASRTSSFQFRGREVGIPEIAKQLNVRHILEGSVRKAGTTVRITAQLIDTKSDRHLWSETFDRPLTTDDVFTIQDQIAQAIVDAMDAVMGVKTAPEVTVAPATENVDAYDLFLRAHQLFIARGKGLKEAVLLYEKATAADPNYARAWAELAAAASVAWSWDVTDRDYNSIALAAAKRAIEIDPSMSLPYAVEGQLHTVTQIPADFEAGIAKLDKALAINPDDTSALVWRGIVYAMIGKTTRAVSDYKKCLAVDPGYSICRLELSLAQITLGNEDDAIRNISEMMLRGFSGPDPHFVGLLLKHGDRVGAVAIAIAATGSASAAAELIGAVEEPDSARRTERLCQLKSEYPSMSNMGVFLTFQCASVAPITDYRPIVQFGAIYNIWLPEYRDYRKTDGFKKMAAALGLPAYWRGHGFPPQCGPVGKNDFECE